MRNQVIFLTAILILTVFLTGCPSGEPKNPLNASNTTPSVNNTNTGAQQTNNNPTNPNAIATPVRTPEQATTNNAPTFAPIVASYYEAIKKKDDAGIRKVLSAAHVKQLEEDMKAEKQTSLGAYLNSIEDLKTPVQVRNEQISGDKGTAELKGGAYLNWTKFPFVKENGEWKISNNFDDVKAVDQTK